MAAKQAMKENLQCTSKYGHLRISQDICHVGWQILRASLPYMGIVTIFHSYDLILLGGPQAFLKKFLSLKLTWSSLPKDSAGQTNGWRQVQLPLHLFLVFLCWWRGIILSKQLTPRLSFLEIKLMDSSWSFSLLGYSQLPDVNLVSVGVSQTVTPLVDGGQVFTTRLWPECSLRSSSLNF